MNTFSTQLSGNTLTAINQVWQYVEFSENAQGKIDKSILEYTAQKFLKKQISRIGKNPKKEFTISINYFELVILERKLREVLDRMDFESHEFSLLIQYCNQLHPQTL